MTTGTIEHWAMMEQIHKHTITVLEEVTPKELLVFP
jgi:hypothetical protein